MDARSSFPTITPADQIKDKRQFTSFTPRSGCIGGSRQGGHGGEGGHVASVRFEAETTFGALVRVRRVGSKKLSIPTVVALGEGERVRERVGRGLRSPDPQPAVSQDVGEPLGDRRLGSRPRLVAPHVGEGVGPAVGGGGGGGGGEKLCRLLPSTSLQLLGHNAHSHLGTGNHIGNESEGLK